MESDQGVTQPAFIYDLPYSALVQLFQDWDEPSYRAAQTWQNLYSNLWQDAEHFTNFPKELRNKLSEHFSFHHLEEIHRAQSKDGETEKLLFKIPNGNFIETVHMRYRDRQTLCISSQSGCAMGCKFCATGQMGFRSNLSSGEIVEQALFFARRLRQEDRKVTNIVIMGMGEPFHNYEATLSAIDTLNHPDGMNLGERRFTISTVGIVPMIQRFTRENHQINLAISLHAADDDLRSSLLPINKKYPIPVLMETCRDYIKTTRRRISFEWALIDGVNDGIDQAAKLAGLISGMLAHVNIIPLNPTNQYQGMPTKAERVLEFKVELERRGIPCTVRLRRGLDIQAGCGQLASQQQQ